jgi:antitoxin component YwqK of YwqJK toxin-antitoxin module
MYIGDYLLFYEDGSLKKKCFYKDGNLEGEYKWLSNDGILLNLSYYINGYLEGESKEWYYDGKLKNIYVYKKGKRKRFQEWDKNGILIKSKV